ncbi:MAG: hypothetical protein AB7F89_27330 [Pirellulaceae bacterium]
MTASAAPSRIRSMDQFRGYTVAGMYLVNFVAPFVVIPALLKHNNTHFSYADSIMPSFLFCAGFSYRLTALRRWREAGAWTASVSFVRRSLALVLLCLFVFSLQKGFDSWRDMSARGVWEYVCCLVKAGMWDVLSIIGVTQLLLLPVIIRHWFVRFATALAMAATHLILTYAFNYEFQFGLPSALDPYFGAHGTRVWDGGLWGPLAWSVPMLAGSLAYDWVTRLGQSAGRAGWGLFLAGCVLMSEGYGLSCLTRLYDVVPGSQGGTARRAAGSPHAPDPVWPEAWRWEQRGWQWAELPGVAPPPPRQRQWNYWMMNKRIVSLSFNTFATGSALFVYALFVWACDAGNWQLDRFRMLGQNPLAAYLIHEFVFRGVHRFAPPDSPWWWIVVTGMVFLLVTFGTVRYLERQRLFFRL